MSTENPTPFVYFDVGGVLYDFKGGLENLSKLIALSLEETTRIWKEYDNQICMGKMTGQDLWKKYKESSGFKKELDFISFWVANFSPIMEMHNLVHQIETEVPIGLLQNVYPGVFAKALTAGKIPKVNFSQIIHSCDVGVVKPDHAIFQLATERAGVTPENIVFIDDSIGNIEAARKEGWRGILFDRSNVGGSIEEIKKKVHSVQKNNASSGND